MRSKLSSSFSLVIGCCDDNEGDDTLLLLLCFGDISKLTVTTVGVVCAVIIALLLARLFKLMLLLLLLLLLCSLFVDCWRFELFLCDVENVKLLCLGSQRPGTGTQRRQYALDQHIAGGDPRQRADNGDQRGQQKCRYQHDLDFGGEKVFHNASL